MKMKTKMKMKMNIKIKMKMKIKMEVITSYLLKLESNRPNVNFLAMLEWFTISVLLEGQFTTASSTYKILWTNKEI